MTLEERAKIATAEKHEGNIVTVITAQGAYIKGATEQKQIDIEKAYEFICNNYADIYNEEIYDCKFDEGWRKAFKKAIEE